MIPNYAVDYEGQYDWLQKGVLTTEQAVLGVAGRDNKAVEALASTGRVIWRPDAGTAAAVIRLRLDANATDGNQFVLHIYAAKGADYYKRVGTITCDCGTQDWSSGHFVDVMVLSSEQWLPGIRVDSTTNEIGLIFLNVAGFDRFVFVSPDFLDDDIDEVHIDIARADLRLDKGIEIHSVLTTVEGDLDSVETLLGSIDSNIEDIETEQTAQGLSLDSAVIDLELIADHADSAVDELQTIVTEQAAQGLSLDSIVVDTELIADHLDSAVDAILAMDSALSDAMVDLETGLRSGTLSALVLHEAGTRSGVASALKDQLWFSDATSTYQILEEISGIHSQAILNVAIIAATESGIRSGVKSAIVVNEAGIRSGVKSVVTSAIGVLATQLSTSQSALLSAFIAV